MPDFVGELLESRDLADLASQIYRLADALRTKLVTDQVKATPTNTALIFFFARCFKTFQAAIELLRMGFWQDAAVLARVLREAEYQVRWIASGGDGTAELFLQDYQRNRRKIMRNMAKHGDPEIKIQAQKVVKGTAANKRLGEWWRNWWSKRPKQGIGWLAEQLGYKAHRFEYATLSAFVHSSPALADFYFHEARDGRMTVESRPGIFDENRDFAKVVAFSVFAASLDVCDLFARQMGFDHADEIKQIGQRIRQIG